MEGSTRQGSRTTDIGQNLLSNKSQSQLWKNYHSEMPKLAAIAPISITLFILISNTIILMVFKRLKKLNTHHYYLVALSVFDLMLVPTLAVTCYTMVSGNIWMTDLVCDTMGILVSIPLSATTNIHCLMCMDKAVSVLKPHTHNSFTRRPRFKLWMKIILICCFAMPAFIFSSLTAAGVLSSAFNAAVCSCAFDLTIVSMMAIVPSCTFGLVAQVLSNVLIFRHILRMPKSNRHRVARVAKTLLVTVGAYYICWLPYVLILSAQFLDGNDLFFNRWAVFSSGYLLIANSFVNIFIYILTLPNFKENLLRSVRISIE